jgi:hypothetical protein
MRAFGVRLDPNVLGQRTKSPSKSPSKSRRPAARGGVAFSAETAPVRPRSAARVARSPFSRARSPSTATRERERSERSPGPIGGRVLCPCFRRVEDADSEDEECARAVAAAPAAARRVRSSSRAAAEEATSEPLPGWNEPRRWIVREDLARAAFDAAASSPRGGGAMSGAPPPVGAGYSASMRTEAGDLDRLSHHFRASTSLLTYGDFREALEEHLYRPLDAVVRDLEALAAERRQEANARRSSLRRKERPAKRAPPPAVRTKKRKAADSSASTASSSSSSSSDDGAGTRTAGGGTPSRRGAKGKARRFTPRNAMPGRAAGARRSAADLAALATTIAVGDIVMARFKAHRFPAKVLAVDRKRKDGCIVKVSYAGWSSRFDSWLAIDRVDGDCAHMLATPEKDGKGSGVRI